MYYPWTHAYIYIHILSHTHTCTYIEIKQLKHTSYYNPRIPSSVPTAAVPEGKIHTCIHAYIYTHTLTHTYTHTHTHTHTHTRTHTHMADKKIVDIDFK